jgi:hypothetical protein
VTRYQSALVHYAARPRNGEVISTAFMESSVNEIIAKRMNKKQQMRWNRATVQPFLDVRTAALNETLEDAFRHRYPGFRPANDDEVIRPGTPYRGRHTICANRVLSSKVTDRLAENQNDRRQFLNAD